VNLFSQLGLHSTIQLLELGRSHKSLQKYPQKRNQIAIFIKWPYLEDLDKVNKDKKSTATAAIRDAMLKD
jgi:hypothetical protein